jgi:NAD(P)-dependent dehydrogenase (short-subunit alcohol dehydrogenase family)
MQSKVYLVTGAASGSGANLVNRLSDQDHVVIAVDINEEMLSSMKNHSKNPRMITSYICDITNEVEVSKMLVEIGKKFASLDGLVNTAGIVTAKRFLEFERSDWERIFAVNVYGTYYLIKYCAPILIKSRSPRIVNFASMAGKIPGPYTAPYAASKAAVISLTQSAAVALAPQITVNCICPGIIHTPMWNELGSDLTKIGFPNHFENRAKQAPLQRAGTADEVTDAILFLLSEGSSYITGESLNITGGLIMH